MEEQKQFNFKEPKFQNLMIECSGHRIIATKNGLVRLKTVPTPISDDPMLKIFDALMKIDFKKKVTSISRSSYHMGFITSDGKVYTMGSNKYGQLGTGLITMKFLNENDIPLLTEDTDNIFSNKPYLVKFPNMEEGDKPVLISCYYNYNAVLTKNGKVYVFGDYHIPTGKVSFLNYMEPERITPTLLTPLPNGELIVNVTFCDKSIILTNSKFEMYIFSKALGMSGGTFYRYLEFFDVERTNSVNSADLPQIYTKIILPNIPNIKEFKFITHSMDKGRFSVNDFPVFVITFDNEVYAYDGVDCDRVIFKQPKISKIIDINTKYDNNEYYDIISLNVVSADFSQYDRSQLPSIDILNSNGTLVINRIDHTYNKNHSTNHKADPNPIVFRIQ